jgi:hypothetical protein
MGDFENRTFVVTGYEAFQQRTFQEDGHVSTRTHLRLEVQRETGPSDRPVTLTYVTFTAHPEDNTHKIGKIAKRPPPHAREFELDVTLPAADFDHYWKILASVALSRQSTGTILGISHWRPQNSMRASSLSTLAGHVSRAG